MVTAARDCTRELEEFGYSLIEELVTADALPGLREEADRLLVASAGRGGARNVLGASRRLRETAEDGAPARVAASILGTDARPTKLTVFDKAPRANWKVPWHQDLTIAVARRVDVPGFGPWSVKEGVPHVQPPTEILARILAIRLHLDDTPETNGALRVLPGTHRLGRIGEASLRTLKDQIGEVVLPVRAGGAMLMRPLLLHASSAALAPTRRRVLHFEYCASPLPAGLDWA